MRLDCPCLDPRLWVCLVGGEIGRMEKKKKREKIVGRSVWLVGGGGGNFGGAQEFSPRATKTQSPQIGEKIV